MGVPSAHDLVAPAGVASRKPRPVLPLEGLPPTPEGLATLELAGLPVHGEDEVGPADPASRRATVHFAAGSSSVRDGHCWCRCRCRCRCLRALVVAYRWMPKGALARPYLEAGGAPSPHTGALEENPCRPGRHFSDELRS